MARFLSLRLYAVGHTLFSRNRKVSRHQRSWGGTLVAALVLATAGVIFISWVWSWSNLHRITMSYRISQAKEIQKQYLEMNRKLRIELSNLTAIHRLEKLALETYGMGPPKPSQVVNLP
ncbi:MAG: hypothetical protein A2Y80_07235 [Deltaproteobacteria bacterium RBG_13_58_19]|nr:MAG: hypothetical protein A2Y80_07235 [Deltaproteobacteria bacterium RBG_13_58_19]